MLLDHKLSPLSIDDQVALKEHAVKLKLLPEAYLNCFEQKLKNLITSKMQPEKLMKVTKEMLLYLPGPDWTLLEQMCLEDLLRRTQFMLQDTASTSCEQVADVLLSPNFTERSPSCCNQRYSLGSSPRRTELAGN